MGLRDIFRRHKKEPQNVPCPSDTNKTKTQPPQHQQQQQKSDNSGLRCLDISATM